MAHGAARPPSNFGAAPVLPAYRVGDLLHVWCRYCKRWHVHGGAAGGHRASHCTVDDSPFRQTGYTLEEISGVVLWVMAP